MENGWKAYVVQMHDLVFFTVKCGVQDGYSVGDEHLDVLHAAVKASVFINIIMCTKLHPLG